MTLVDRAVSPRRKACGEGLFPAGIQELERLGVSEEVREGSVPIRGVRFRRGNAVAHARFPADAPAIGIAREVLDTALERAVREADVTVCTGVSVTGIAAGSGHGQVTLETANGPMTARFVIAADGLHSRLRHAAGLDASGRGSRYGISAHARTEAATDMVEVRFMDDLELYITPVAAGAANVAVLGSRGSIGRLGAGGMAGFRALVERELGGTLVDAPLARGPFPVRARRLSRGRVVLAGDAAGFFDGITGEGMSVALQGGALCARAVDAALVTGTRAPLATYERRTRRLARNSTALGALTLLLAARPTLARLAIRQLAAHPDTFDRMLAINAGVTGFGALSWRDLGVLRP